MFPNSKSNRPSKHEMVSTWRNTISSTIAGHSARRSGAMAYVRKGMNIRDLAYLGRWKSSVVLTYAEEALETTPANKCLAYAPDSTVTPQKPCRVMVEPVLKEPKKVGDDRHAGDLLRNRPKAASLWVKSTERGASNPLHLVTNADWSLPMASWTTAYGWSFAKRSAQISFVTNPNLNSLKCKKCTSMSRLRDEVNKGINPAQMLAGDIDQLGKQMDGSDRCRSANRPLKKRRVEGGTCLRSEVS